MSQFYQRREKFEDIPELRPFPVVDLEVGDNELVVPEDPNIQAYYREQDAAGLQSDVHIYRKLGSQFIGIALRPGAGPNVKIWEH